MCSCHPCRYRRPSPPSPPCSKEPPRCVMQRGVFCAFDLSLVHPWYTKGTMKHIASTHNDTYKNLKQLASGAKYRRREGRTLLEGVHLCESYLAQGGVPLMCVYSNEALENPEVAAILEQCDPLDTLAVFLTDAHFKAISSVEHGVGILCVIPIVTPEPVSALTHSAVLLEAVQDPGNMGAILRTAAAAGITEVYSSAGSVSAWSPKVLRAGMGAHFALTIYENTDLAAVISGATVPVLATSLRATQSLYDTDLSGPAAWVLGNEGAGVSTELLALKNVQTVIIPQKPGVESLNVAAATAVCLFEQVRQAL